MSNIVHLDVAILKLRFFEDNTARAPKARICFGLSFGHGSPHHLSDLRTPDRGRRVRLSELRREAQQAPRRLLRLPGPVRLARLPGPNEALSRATAPY